MTLIRWKMNCFALFFEVSFSCFSKVANSLCNNTEVHVSTAASAVGGV